MLRPMSFLMIVLGAAWGARGAAATQPATQPSGELALKVANGVSIKLVLIPAGSFMMGSPPQEKDRSDNEGPRHEVKISKPFFIGVTPVTQKQWKAVMGNEPWEGKYAQANDNNAASGVTWIEAMQFCNKLSARTGRRVRLPTEAQWEYACRAGTQTRFYYGDDPDSALLGDYAWYDKNTFNIDQPYPHRVGQKKPNAWGLYDMHGNVNQWCTDWLGVYPSHAVTDPTGPAGGTMRVLRGGSFVIGPKYCRAAWRNRNIPGRRVIDNGCRVVVLP